MRTAMQASRIIRKSALKEAERAELFTYISAQPLLVAAVVDYSRHESPESLQALLESFLEESKRKKEEENKSKSSSGCEDAKKKVSSAGDSSHSALHPFVMSPFGFKESLDIFWYPWPRHKPVPDDEKDLIVSNLVCAFYSSGI